jgi:hypothetical protein
MPVLALALGGSGIMALSLAEAQSLTRGLCVIS